MAIVNIGDVIVYTFQYDEKSAPCREFFIVTSDTEMVDSMGQAANILLPTVADTDYDPVMGQRKIHVYRPGWTEWDDAISTFVMELNDWEEQVTTDIARARKAIEISTLA